MIDVQEVGLIAASLKAAGVIDFDIGFDSEDRPLIQVRPNRPAAQPIAQSPPSTPSQIEPELAKLAYSVEEAAKALSVGKSTVWRWIHEHRLKTIKLGARTVIRREELAGLLASRRPGS